MEENRNALVGQRIKQARTMRNMTLDDVADAIKVTKSTIQRYETAQIKRLKMPVLESIAKVLDVNPVWLIGKSDQMIIKSENGNPETQQYYFDPKSAEMAQSLFQRKEMRVLFDVARDAKSEDLKTATDMLLLLKQRERYDGDDPA